ncbi:hypothetical protein RND81_06G191300 [Saponaria officinalis]|uniref:NAC domain-containing protein n=1 Tax=Saponaria officinalis TaxID=3572 RepID=A0AAW1KDK0_SAPOF
MADNNLPPGFRFFPTDEELVVHFLHRRDGILPFRPDVIPDLDVYPYNPWDLEGKALREGSKRYYYSRRVQHRVTESGYWKQMGVDEPIMSSTSSMKIVGIKKYFVFYIGEPHAAASDWTTWIMHEYSLPDSPSSSRSSSKRRSNSKKDFSRWVICKVYEQRDDDDGDGDDETELSCLDEVFLSMEDLEDISLPN